MCSVNYPFPPNLKYKYPPASMKVFKNIMNAMASVPKFYEQVLHLMNKMNLPPPFEEDLPGPEWVKLKRKREDLASDESELESEEEKPLSPVEPPSASIENNEQFKNQFISIETLTLNRVHIEEIIAIPAFKNYVPGNPSSTLYIKNISKKATEADLLFIFGRYFDSQSELKQLLNIRLMTEGKLKGQAFVKMGSIDRATSALRQVNGYVLYEKPIQYGKEETKT